ncbi:MAG: DUF1444 domain-containing protein [Planctomycetota bacterium]|jgi:uncharacterized protein YtpQ (UPF0354 family)
MAVPPGWRVEDGAERIRLIGPDTEAVAVVSVAKTPGVPLAPVDAAYLRKTTSGLRLVRHVHENEGRRDGLEWARTDDLVGPPVPWWKRALAVLKDPMRLLRRSEVASRLIKVCYTRGTLLALLTIEVRPLRFEHHELSIGAMIRSLQLAQCPAPAPPEFVDNFLQTARKRWPERSFQRGDETLVVKADGAEISLEGSYRAMVQESGLGDEVLAPLLGYLSVNPIPQAGTERFADVEERVLPSIRTRAWFEEEQVRRLRRDELVCLPLPHDLVVTFVVSYDEVAARFVTREESERWEMPPKLMYRVARANLTRLRDDLQEHLIVTQDGTPHALALAEGDGYDAARLLLPDLRDRLIEHLGPDFAIAIPSRDFLIAFRTDQGPLLTRMRRLIEDDPEGRSHPITTALFRLTDHGIEAF